VVWGIGSLRVPRLFRTTSFRLSALGGGLFALCFGAFLLFTYWSTTAVLEQQLRARVGDELHAFVTEANTDGAQTVVQDIGERLSTLGPAIGFYYVAGANNQKLAGNIRKLNIQTGWQKIDQDGDDNNDEDHQIWGEGIILSDGTYIFVGQDAFRLLAAQETIINSFFWSGGLALILAVLAGMVVSRQFLGRIDDINKTSLAILEGKQKERIPLRGTADEIDLLSVNLNRLFDSNHALMESLKQVSTNIAHDLRTPLSRLRQNLDEALHQNHTKKNLKAKLGEAIQNSDQLLAIFAALLRIAQIESGSRKLAFARVNLSEIFQRVTNVYQAVAEDKDKVLVAHISPEIYCLGDTELLLLMIVNLVENAIRHTPSGTKIELTVEKLSGTIRATVADTGPGIAPEFYSKVMERFFRLESSRNSPGSGLGLSLVAAIAALHDTEITMSDNGPGLRVEFILPPA
jgi:signal transduction histidine kinase